MRVRAERTDRDQPLDADLVHGVDDVLRALNVRGVKRIALGFFPDPGQMDDVGDVVKRHAQRGQIIHVADDDVRAARPAQKRARAAKGE